MSDAILAFFEDGLLLSSLHDDLKKDAEGKLELAVSTLGTAFLVCRCQAQLNFLVTALDGHCKAHSKSPFRSTIPDIRSAFSRPLRRPCTRSKGLEPYRLWSSYGGYGQRADTGASLRGGTGCALGPKGEPNPTEDVGYREEGGSGLARKRISGCNWNGNWWVLLALYTSFVAEGKLKPSILLLPFKPNPRSPSRPSFGLFSKHYSSPRRWSLTRSWTP